MGRQRKDESLESIDHIAAIAGELAAQYTARDFVGVQKSLVLIARNANNVALTLFSEIEIQRMEAERDAYLKSQS